MNEEEDTLTINQCIANGQGFYPCANDLVAEGSGSGVIVLDLYERPCDGHTFMDKPVTETFPIALFYNGGTGSVSPIGNARNMLFRNKRELVEPKFLLKFKE